VQPIIIKNKGYMNKIFFLLPLALSLPLSVSASPPEQMSTRLQLAEVDYAVIHSSFINKCMESYPDSVSELTKEIFQWDKDNSPALKKLKDMAAETLEKKLEISKAEAIAQSAQIVAMMTNGLKAQFDKVSGVELKAACNGGYAATSLKSPMLNFSELLDEVVLSKKVN
jgi:hypothetical protein